MSKAKQISIIGIFSALATLLMLLEIPMPQLVGFKYDGSEIATLMVGFMIGPWAGILTEIIKDLLYFAIRGTDIIGILMNLAAGIIFVGTASWIYKIHKTKVRAVFSMIAASLATTVGMAGLNLLVYPPYLHVSYIFILKDYLWIIVLFNLLKTGIDSTVVFLVYKKISTFFKVENWEGKKFVEGKYESKNLPR
ncbi:ECF transporter S component [Athalassotoga saccharophila]|uniref:ECF transporter S component n=1 Tax=Athalassotoga saccharophila TaxID=1441386 RepID=UPI00137ABA25|nr:ECF transporter S component [Athalassotoga saccharophila]BBJ28806.1 riboflavin transporter RibU [Athalassotoga saccharophila]